MQGLRSITFSSQSTYSPTYFVESSKKYYNDDFTYNVRKFWKEIAVSVTIEALGDFENVFFIRYNK